MPFGELVVAPPTIGLEYTTRLTKFARWIDVPVVYKTGRRALLTMEKGIPGEKVFDEALKAWAAKTSG